ncbi:MAG: pyridoxamine 5'-phosphate oxidase family protein [Acidobacteriota bacterium]
MSDSPLAELDLPGITREAWRVLAAAPANPANPLRLPMMATVDAAGRPRSRTVVLREVDVDRGVLEVHTDKRSGKIEDLRFSPHVELCFYTARHRLQIRAPGVAAVHTDGAVVSEAWARLSPPGRSIYQRPAPPASPLDDPDDAVASESLGSRNFVVIRITVESLDWLLLRREGTRRARLGRRGTGWEATWITP